MSLTNLLKDERGMTFPEFLWGTIKLGAVVVFIGLCYQGYNHLKIMNERPSVQRENVIEGDKKDQFIDQDGIRYIGKIDGMTTEQYINSIKQNQDTDRRRSIYNK